MLKQEYLIKMAEDYLLQIQIVLLSIQKKIVSQGVAVKIFFDKDSIFHSNLQFKYIDMCAHYSYTEIRMVCLDLQCWSLHHNITMILNY